ncbi:hypothetical protein [Maricaulis parjimensis]|uniref:hypothetical protein n=1 Tax=Maricaulis parjimensis TaxID=144023 RepID=UPI00193997A4|nr:hypothetical protein [Maricaulis parjimensis]
MCLALIFSQASTWQVAGALVVLGYDEFQIFGTDARMVIDAMPTFTMGFAAGTFQACILAVFILLLARRKRAMHVLLGAAILHVLIWVRVSFNPYVPAWPGLVIFTSEVICMVMLSMLANRRLLR